jgi:hypothetical protein
MNENKVMSVGDWMITMLIASIPLVGFIMLFVWAFSEGTSPSKKNWARATLIFLIILFVLYFIIGAALFGALAAFY